MDEEYKEHIHDIDWTCYIIDDGGDLGCAIHMNGASF